MSFTIHREVLRIDLHSLEKLHARPTQAHGGAGHRGGAGQLCRRRPPAADQHLGGQPAAAGAGAGHGRDPAAPQHPQAQPDPGGRTFPRRLRHHARRRTPGPAAAAAAARCARGRAAHRRTGRLRPPAGPRPGATALGPPGPEPASGGGGWLHRPGRPAHRSGHTLRPPARQQLGGPAHRRKKHGLVRGTGLSGPARRAGAAGRAGRPRLARPAPRHRADPGAETCAARTSRRSCSCGRAPAATTS